MGILDAGLLARTFSTLCVFVESTTLLWLLFSQKLWVVICPTPHSKALGLFRPVYQHCQPLSSNPRNKSCVGGRGPYLDGQHPLLNLVPGTLLKEESQWTEFLTL